MKRHQPVVEGFSVRPPTYPDGHWMNRFWGPLARAAMAFVSRVPFHRHVPRIGDGARAVLASGRPVIFACVHQDVFDTFNGLPRVLNRPLAAMVSYSRDGDLAALGLRALGYHVVRGSSSRGGGEGLLALRSHLQAGVSVVMACDGPKAPLGDVKGGVVKLAAHEGVPVLPVRSWGLARLRLYKSWTRSALSLPFLPVVVCIGEPVLVPPGTKDTRPYQLAIAREIASLAARASAWADGPPLPPFHVLRT